ncbi:MAG: hypothetical protein JNL67_02995 [Planctomycetaceae bacterium]|nr:hypothetical protein [Planctomycetaceae bacterium]
MSSTPVRESHPNQSIPIEKVIRSANRVDLETVLIVIAYAAVFLRLVALLDWEKAERFLMLGSTLVLGLVWAGGIFHARMRWCVADQLGRRPTFPLYWLWPLHSMLLLSGLLVLAIGSWLLGLIVSLACFTAVSVLVVQNEIGVFLGVVMGALPGALLGIVLASSVVTKLGHYWLKLT